MKISELCLETSRPVPRPKLPVGAVNCEVGGVTESYLTYRVRSRQKKVRGNYTRTQRLAMGTARGKSSFESCGGRTTGERAWGLESSPDHLDNPETGLVRYAIQNTHGYG